MDINKTKFRDLDRANLLVDTCIFQRLLKFQYKEVYIKPPCLSQRLFLTHIKKAIGRKNKNTCLCMYLCHVVKWITSTEILQYNFRPANEAVLKRIVEVYSVNEVVHYSMFLVVKSGSATKKICRSHRTCQTH